MPIDKYISQPIKVATTGNKESITALCESVMLKELKILDNTSNGDTLENKACQRLQVVAEVLKVVKA